MLTLHRYAAAALSLVLVVALVIASSTALQRSADRRAVVVGTPVSLGEITVEADRHRASHEDVLWLARVIHSETKRPHEQELVAWVVRNRVETRYRGNETYREAVLDPYQFSAFNRGSHKRSHYMGLTSDNGGDGFKTALAIAARVANAPAEMRPFSQTTRHFYSERSMRGGRTPRWAWNKRPVALKQEVDERRFRFFANIS